MATKEKRPTKKQKALMKKLGIEIKKGMTCAEASRAIGLKLDFLPPKKQMALKNMTYEEIEYYEMDEDDFFDRHLDGWGDC